LCVPPGFLRTYLVWLGDSDVYLVAEFSTVLAVCHSMRLPIAMMRLAPGFVFQLRGCGQLAHIIHSLHEVDHLHILVFRLLPSFSSSPA
jgi:hypothetical protein